MKKLELKLSNTPNFRIIEENIDTKPFIDELNRNEVLWGMVSSLDNIGGDLNPYGFLPLTMGVQYGDVSIKNSECQMDTPAKQMFPVLNQWLIDHGLDQHSRAAFFRLKPNGTVAEHIDDGEYYLTRDRYHLSIQGAYRYTVGGESRIILPGEFFWFDNKKPHSAENLSTIDRITFVFDVPKHPTNP